MSFRNPVVGGGGELIRDQIKSSNYVPTVSGWIIARNGNAEFNGATFRGKVEVLGPDDSAIVIDLVTNPAIQLFPNNPGGVYTYDPALLQSASYADDLVGLQITSPAYTPGADYAVIDLFGETLTDPAQIEMSPRVRVKGFGVNDGEFEVLGNIDVTTTITNSTDTMIYMRGQAGQAQVNIGAATSFVLPVVFPVAFPAGVTPIMPCPNLNTSAAAGQLWTLRATNVTNVGFSIIGIRAAAAVALNAPIDWVAMVVN